MLPGPNRPGHMRVPVAQVSLISALQKDTLAETYLATGQETAKLEVHSSSCIDQQVRNLSIGKSRISRCQLGLQVCPSLLQSSSCHHLVFAKHEAETTGTDNGVHMSCSLFGGALEAFE